MAKKTTKKRTAKATKATTMRPARKRTANKAQPVNADVSARYGCRPGSKVAVAASMFEEGAKMADVKKEVGITQYNFLTRMEARGHEVKRDEDGVITLRHVKDAS